MQGFSDYDDGRDPVSFARNLLVTCLPLSEAILESLRIEKNSKKIACGLCQKEMIGERRMKKTSQKSMSASVQTVKAAMARR